MTNTFSDKPWRYDGFGCVRCGQHVVLQLPPDLADKVSPEELVAIGKLAAMAPELRRTLDELLTFGRLLTRLDFSIDQEAVKRNAEAFYLALDESQLLLEQSVRNVQEKTRD